MRRLVSLLVVIALAVLVNAVVVGDLRPPPRWDPTAPLDVAAEPAALVTRLKLMRLEHDPAACRAALETARLEWSPVDDKPSNVGCGLTDAVRLTGGTPRLSRDAVTSCPLAVALAYWQHQSLAPAAHSLLGTKVARLEHWGTHVCRNIAGSSRRSEHATANAIDIAAFVLADGRRVSVRGDWGKGDAEARFLEHARDGACEVFDVVLSPDYNAAHDDHLHLDMGSFGACR